MAVRKRKSTGNSPRKRKGTSSGLALGLSPGERTALLSTYQLAPRTRQKLETAADQTLRFTRNELGIMLVSVVSKLEIDPGPMDHVLALVRERIVQVLEEANPPAFGGEYLRRLDDGPGTCKLFFQFRIELLDTNPPIWRRIQIADGPLSSLHDAIQGAFDWEEEHLHAFEIGGLQFGPPPPEGFLDFGPPQEDETQIRISQLLPSSGKQTVWLYTYDFGDSWRHAIEFEGCGPLAPRTRYPLCMDGSRAAPPEDCGGPWGFADILHALEHPDDDRDEEMMEWLGPFDPAAFDAARATKKMRALIRQARRR